MLIVGAANLQNFIESTTKNITFTTFVGLKPITPMKIRFFFAFLVPLVVVTAFSCKPQQKQQKAVEATIDYSDTAYWYSCGDESHTADVFYVYPTVSTISFADNDSSWFADISLPEVREEANGNQRFNKMLYGEYNFYAPYYRQMIFERLSAGRRRCR